ncbi:MAG: histidinol-phosphate aminotransferase family protein, partial [Firmicutes bacterium]|nr:histidinol-phosphate aminotransferase family protein [Bacillota bacterium]
AFSEYQKGLELVGCHVLHHSQPRENEFRTDAESLMGFIAATRPDMVFLGLPSNPTGTMIEKEDLIRICDCAEDAGAVVVIDRSFVHFVENKSKYFFKSEALSRKNVILLDSMTKIFAMAGLRLGYMITGNDEIVSKVENCLQPWPVSSPAEDAGIAAFEVGPGFFEETKRYVAEERTHLESGLRMLGMEVFESQANYVFFRSPRDLEGLKEKGILLRNCGNYWSLDDSYYRAAVRTHEENERLLFELYELLKEEAHG